MSSPASAWRSRYETKDQEDEHSCFSDNTNADILGDQVGIRRVYLGELPDGTTVRHEHQHARGEGRPQARRRRSRAQLDTAVADIEAFPAPFEELIVGDDDAARAGWRCSRRSRRSRTRASRSPRSRTSSGSKITLEV